ncbi:MAG TPA: GNAT family N-acetyltransferase [Candidatus Limnocylindria bacterium]|nr:GNAT family N-acetyltransferase [Candidatus Limnocylindria bacterium]
MATATQQRRARAQDRAIVALPTRDKGLLRAFLERDRLRAGYAVADLEEREFAKCRWGVASEGTETIAVVLEYGGLTPQPLFVMGDPDGIVAILRDVIKPRLAFLAADDSLLAPIGSVYRIDAGPPMVRMAVDRRTFQPVPGPVQRLVPVDIADLNRLYGLGFAGWLPADSITNGVYYGVRIAGRLVAAAGTHVISPEGRIAAVGNVMTHTDFRGRGFAKQTTSAVTQELLRTCDDVVLNVRADNPPALAAYRALGYRDYCHFEERLVHRRGSAPWDSIVTYVTRALLRPKES